MYLWFKIKLPISSEKNGQFYLSDHNTIQLICNKKTKKLVKH